ncbi:MAG: N-acetylmuramoyl-L-alanine amidase [bacterium]
MINTRLLKFFAYFILVVGISCPALDCADELMLFSNKIILLDPGHGVKNEKGIIINKGMKANGINEQDIIIDIAELLGKRLESSGFKVYYTRNRENFWRVNNDIDEDNYDRAQQANVLNADAFIKIHLDWNRKKSVSGTRTYYLKRNSKELAENIQKYLVKSTELKDKGICQEWFKGLEEVNMPAALVEVCFISNPNEARLLRDVEFLEKVSDGIYLGILKTIISKDNP